MYSTAVRNIPKFKDRASWSHDTFQPMRRHACVYRQTNQNITPVLKNFQNNGRSRRTELPYRTVPYRTRLGFTFNISKKTFHVRESEHYSLQGIIGVFELFPDRSQWSWLHRHGLQDF